MGIRGDLYNGLATARQAEPRLGVAYNFKQNQYRAARFLRGKRWKRRSLRTWFFQASDA